MQQNAARVEEAAAAVEALTGEAGQLSALMEQYEVDVAPASLTALLTQRRGQPTRERAPALVPERRAATRPRSEPGAGLPRPASRLAAGTDGAPAATRTGPSSNARARRPRIGGAAPRDGAFR